MLIFISLDTPKHLKKQSLGFCISSHQLSLSMPKHMCCGVATATDDDELEKRLAKIRQAKGATPDGEGVKEQRRRTGTGTGIKPATDEPKPKPAAGSCMDCA